MTHADVRLLSDADRSAVDAFLAMRPGTTMILRSNLRAAGFRDEGQQLQGTYAGAFDAAGELCGVAASYWNGNVVFEASTAIPELVRVASEGAGRAPEGLLGAADQVEAAMEVFEGESVPFDSTEVLLALELGDLCVPGALARGELVARTPRKEEEELTLAWRLDFMLEAMNAEATPELTATQRESLVRIRDERQCWLLFADGEPVSFTAFNAQVPDCVQVGGVWTPPEYRGRGYARAAVAASLLDAQSGGAVRSFLFTDVGNEAALRCYAPLGYRRAGDYRIVRRVPG